MRLDLVTGCWHWRGGPTIRFRRREWRPRRLAAHVWLDLGEDDRRQVRPVCLTPDCVYPGHLRIGPAPE